MVGNIYCGLGLLFCLLQKNARFADIATLPGEEVNVLHDSRCCCGGAASRKRNKMMRIISLCAKKESPTLSSQFSAKFLILKEGGMASNIERGSHLFYGEKTHANDHHFAVCTLFDVVNLLEVTLPLSDFTNSLTDFTFS